MNAQLDTMARKVFLDLLPVEVMDVKIHDSKASAPLSKALSELAIVGIEDAVKEGEVIVNLLITGNSKSCLCGLDNSFHGRHRGRIGGEDGSWREICLDDTLVMYIAREKEGLSREVDFWPVERWPT
jgi:hypothetical protein